MKNIKFIINYAPHAAGEVASFDDALANIYIQNGIAQEHTFEEVVDAVFEEVKAEEVVEEEVKEPKKSKKVGE